MQSPADARRGHGTTESVIVAEDLSRRFGATLAVDRLNLEVVAGEVFGLLGHNGAGKTTTIRLLNGVLAPSGGTVAVLGLVPERDGTTLRRRTGVLTETPSLDERLTARENLQYYAELYDVPPADVPRRTVELLKAFDLADRADERVGRFSKGMKQRLALARALFHRPEILFLDEPTSGLDPIAARHVRDLIVRLSREERRTVFLCTHNLVEAQQLCDRVAVLERGRLIAIGTPAEIARKLGFVPRLEVEVDPDDRPAAEAALAKLPGVVVDDGDGPVLTATVRSRQDVPTLLAALVTAGVRVYRATPRDPSLEEVYFALHEGEEVRS